MHSLGCLWRNWSANIPQLTTSWSSIWQTVWTNALVVHRGYLLWAATNWSRSSLCPPGLHYTVTWPLSTSIWSYFHPIACCFLFLLLPALGTAVKCPSWVILLVAAIAGSWWTKWCMGYCCVSPGGAKIEAPVFWLDSDPIAPGWCCSGAITCCCGKVMKMITKRNGKSWRLYSLLQVKMEWVTANLHIQFKLNPAAYNCRGFQWSRVLQ